MLLEAAALLLYIPKSYLTFKTQCICHFLQEAFQDQLPPSPAKRNKSLPLFSYSLGVAVSTLC